MQSRTIKSPILLFAALFFLSGAAGLIYEIVWERLLELYFGVTLTAITLIVAAYMGGLGLGSLLGGQVAGRIKRPVLLYGLIEAGIGLFGLASPNLINWIGQQTAGSSYLLVFLLSFGLLLIPTVLMGMTLPLLTQSFVNRVETAGHVIGLLYGINTLGAAFGTVLAGYGLIGWLGLDGAIRCATGLNLLVAVGAILFSGQQAKIREAARKESSKVVSVPLKYAFILGAAFLVGFIDMGFEMLWFRTLGVLNKSTAYGFPTILFVFLSGLALGGFVFGRRADESRNPVRLFWNLQIGVGLVTTASFLLLWAALHIPAIQPWLQQFFSNFQHPATPFLIVERELIFSRRVLVTGMLAYLLPIFILVFPASLLMGGGLPVLDRIAIQSADVSGRRVGDIHLANILGSVGGTLAASFAFLPLLGSEWTLKLLAAFSLLFTALLIGQRIQPAMKSLAGLPAGLVVILLLLPGRSQFYTKIYATATGLRTQVLESGDGVLALNFQPGSNYPARLWIGGVQNSYFPTDGRYERSVLTCAGATRPKRVLLIGLGGGNSAYFLSQLPGVNEVVIVELMQNLGSFLEQYVPVAQRLFASPNVTYHVDDGRRYLYANPNERFDLIYIDPLFSFTAGHNNLYSQQAMELYRSHLTAGGVFCGWIDEEHIIPKTAASVFPYLTHFKELVVGANQPYEFDRAYMQTAYSHYLSVSDGLLGSFAAETMDPSKALQRKRADGQGVLLSEKNTPILTDMNPLLEYYYFHAPIVP